MAITLKQSLLNRLTASHPGWPIYDDLLELIKSLEFEDIEIEYVGRFLASGARLVFGEPKSKIEWPAWLPSYASALYGMKADQCEMEGGYARRFRNTLAKRGSLFSPAGNDKQLGFPLIDLPPDTYDFQANESGATFFINKSLEVLYPNADDQKLVVMDCLEKFTQKNIRQAIDNRRWFSAYSGNLKSPLID